MNRIDKLLREKEDVLSIYFTAGHPQVDTVKEMIICLERSGVDMVEIGIPYRDSIVDGLTIQKSSTTALKNGMTLQGLFKQLCGVREKTEMPLLMMGALNPVMQLGVEQFIQKCTEVGIDGLIIPDLPIDIYDMEFKSLVEKHQLHMIFLITPQTSVERVRMIDAIGSGFIYMVSDASITGAKDRLSEKQIEYFKRIRSMDLQLPLLIGFGISNSTTFSQACSYAKGAIIGSAFINAIDQEGELEENIENFISGIFKVYEKT